MKFAKTDSNFSLLLVEDDKVQCGIIARLVTYKYPNCTLYTAKDGVQGVQKFEHFTPDLVMTDINLPRMDGLEMIRTIGSIKPGTRCIVMTARNDDETIEKCRNIGLNEFVQKPLKLKELFEAIDRCIR